MIQLIQLVVQVISLAIWGIIGFIFWIPLLVRVTAVFSVIILIYAFNNQDTSNLRTYLDSAIGFYDRGFKIINSTFGNDNPPITQNYMPTIKRGRVIFELLTTIVFWGSLVLSVSFFIR